MSDYARMSPIDTLILSGNGKMAYIYFAAVLSACIIMQRNGIECRVFDNCADLSNVPVIAA